MEKLLELSDITLIPKEHNSGWNNKKINYFVQPSIEVTGITKSLPIFTSPMEAIVGVDNWKEWQNNGIRPILPRSVDLRTRLEACNYIFSAFSISEVTDNFLYRDLRGSRNQLYVCIDSGNGHDVGLLELGQKLKQMYGQQLILMGGNIGHPQVYNSYNTVGFDYVRVGISSGSLVDKNKYGFHYPMASLLSTLGSIKKSTKGSTKIVADGGIGSCSDILKSIALGADYVMMGYEFSKFIESSGTIYKRVVKPDPDMTTLEEVTNPNSLKSLSKVELVSLDLVRQYFGSTTPEIRALRDGYNNVNSWMSEKKPKIKVNDSEWIWVNVDKSITDWINDFKECVNYGFMMTNSTSWDEFKSNAICGRLN